MDNVHISRRAALIGALGMSTAVAMSRIAWAQEGASFSARIDKDVENLDPPFRTGAVDGNVIRSVFQRLISFKAGEYVWELDAASSIEQVSPLEIAFTLKRGQIFSDGYGEMTAEDVKFSFERYIRPDASGNVSSYKDDWANLVEVKVHDTYSGSLMFSQPAPSVWNVALVGSSGALQSRKAVEALGARHSQAPVGSGPYKVASFVPQQGVTLVLHPEFSAYKPDFSTCNLRYISNPKTAELALQAGEIDFTEFSISAADALAGAEGITVVKRPGQRFIWFGMNMGKAPLNNLAVRQAIRAALDVDQMILAGYRGDAPRLNSMIPPGLVGYWPDAPVDRRDVSKARELLASAGVTMPLTLELTILNEPAFQNMALVAQALLSEVGINVEIDQREAGTYWSSGKEESGKELELFILRFNAHIDPNFNARWFLPDQIGGWNWQRFDSPEFADLQEKSLLDVNQETRGQTIVEMQKLMYASASMVWLTSDVLAFGHSDGIEPAIMPNGNDWQLHLFKAS